MFLDPDKNVCKLSNETEIKFYAEYCPTDLKPFVPVFKGDFWLRQGIDSLDFEEEFDMARYCPTASVHSGSSSHSSIDSMLTLQELQ